MTPSNTTDVTCQFKCLNTYFAKCIQQLKFSNTVSPCFVMCCLCILNLHYCIRQENNGSCLVFRE